ncbi:MAG: TIGR00282 family metallophosphoesterase [Candidatus Margulisiibacteriota bacterium]
MKVLFIGDIVGQLGRDICRKVIPDCVSQYKPDIIIANGENSAHGYSITEKVYKELLEMGVQVVTMGNHIWEKKEYQKDPDKFPRLIRPANYPAGAPGSGYITLDVRGTKITVVNLLGRVFMQCLDCPFQAAQKMFPELQKAAKVIIVDMHAEATSEKCALAHFLDGKASAVLGTHTHVMTADERILPGGTAFISDIGMVGAYDSIIGMEKEQIVKRFLTQMPEKFQPTEKGPGLFNAVLLTVDPASGQTSKIERIYRVVEG